MEIITYVVSGALEHKDSLGTGSVIRRGEVQRMTAGTGIRHSEFNPSANEAVRLLQIWITPDKKGLEPSYEQRTIGDDQKQGRLRLIASKNSRDGGVTINQDADVYAALLNPNEKLTHSLRPGRTAWVQVITGNVSLNGKRSKPATAPRSKTNHRWNSSPTSRPNCCCSIWPVKLWRFAAPSPARSDLRSSIPKAIIPRGLCLHRPPLPPAASKAAALGTGRQPKSSPSSR